MRRFAQVDVFSDRLCQGNPVAVVMDSDGLDDDAMQRFAQWTNLSETTFILPPMDPAADYRVRIFTPDGEFLFAGHPTLGSARAWLDLGGEPRSPGELVQECGIGLVRIRRDETPSESPELAFLAPPLLRSGPVDDEMLDLICSGLDITRGDVVDHQWVDNGPGFVGLLLKDPGAVLSLRPIASRLARQKVGVAAPYPNPEPGQPQLEVRSLFLTGGRLTEDPVTGSLNAGLGQWLTAAGHLPKSYIAAQGQLLGRRGRVFIDRLGDDVWVGGHTTTLIRGETTI